MANSTEDHAQEKRGDILAVADRRNSAVVISLILVVLICLFSMLPLGCATTTGENTFKLSEDFDMVVGQMAQLEDTDIEVMLEEAHGPPPDCFDCPNTATLVVHRGQEIQELSYTFSGNMPSDLLQQARRKAAFGYVFVAQRIDEGSFTLQVELDTQTEGNSTLRLYEDFDMAVGQIAQLEDTDIEVMLEEAHGPPSDCFDCPNTATLVVYRGQEIQELSYTFSGMMVWELMQQARKKVAFGYVFVAQRIDEGSFTLWVEPDTQ